MPTVKKEQTVEQAREWYDRSIGVLFADYRGLKHKELNELRKDLRKKGAEVHVLKNTLFRIAAGKEVTNGIPMEMHNGTTAYAFVFKNEAEVSKAVLDYARTSKKLIVKGGLFSGRAVTAKEVEAISELPPRDVLISQVIGAIAAPLSNLVGVVEALYADPIRVIGAVADKVAEGSPSPEPVEEAVEASAPETPPEAPAEPAVEAVAEAEPAAAPGEASVQKPQENA